MGVYMILRESDSAFYLRKLIGKDDGETAIPLFYSRELAERYMRAHNVDPKIHTIDGPYPPIALLRAVKDMEANASLKWVSFDPPPKSNRLPLEPLSHVKQQLEWLVSKGA